ncbi:unannotated protein [freshwater metagenome]|uniref:Unannotated protein n=1 Tax=freshwater metagenome TaxID=449393 RepID=A0A6J7GQQ5_9ZZZZ|nr:DUF2283 domain-containing protein [Actinomycetota bacterium]
MRKTFDPDASAIYVYVDENADVTRSVSFCDSISIDFASDSHPVGIEVLAVDEAGVPLDMTQIHHALAKHPFPAGAAELIAQPCAPVANL